MTWIKPKWRYVLDWFSRTLLYILFGWFLAMKEIEEEYKVDKKCQALDDRIEKRHKEWLNSKEAKKE